MSIENTHEIEDSLEKYGVFASHTRGFSMWPLFRTHRDIVYIAKADKPLKRGDVALYTGGDGKYILHRVLRVKDKEYLIRGDNTYRIEHVPHECVIGVLMEFDRKGKHHTTSDFSYRFYSALWMLLYPFRFVAYHTARALWRLYKRLFKKQSRSNPEQ